MNELEPKPKKKQNKKKGEVIRVSSSAFAAIKERNVDNKPLIEVVDEMLSEYEHLADEFAQVLDAPTYYALVSEGRMFDSIDVARGEAIVSAVRKKTKPEEPRLVKVLM